MLPANSLTPGSPLTMLAVATATATPATILLLRGQSQQITIVLESVGTTSGGTLQIEEAYFPETATDGPLYAGTWSPLGAAIAASSFTGGAQQVVHIVGYSCWAVRVRIATPITGGGTVSAYGWGN